MTERHDKDFYETPEAATYPMMVDAIREGASMQWHSVLDLGCGDGRLGLGARAAYRFATGNIDGDVGGIELDSERATKANANGVTIVEAPLEDVDWRSFFNPSLVIANPPFSLALQFLEYAHDVRDDTNADVLFLLPVGYLGSQGRHAFWSTHQPDAMRVHSKRLSFTGDGKTANADYAWFYWGDALRGVDFYP